MSSPNLNNLIIIGCILVYIAGVLFGLKKEGDRIICQVFNNQLLHKASHSSFSIYNLLLKKSTARKKMATGRFNALKTLTKVIKTCRKFLTSSHLLYTVKSLPGGNMPPFFFLQRIMLYWYSKIIMRFSLTTLKTKQ